MADLHKRGRFEAAERSYWCPECRFECESVLNFALGLAAGLEFDCRVLDDCFVWSLFFESGVCWLLEANLG